MSLAAAIIDYDAGNLRSVQRACAEVGVHAEITADPQRIAAADRVIFPGVGAAGSAMRTLKQRGLDQAIKAAINSKTPVLGICLGLQISLQHSEEGDTPTLGLIEGQVKKFRFDEASHRTTNLAQLKIPHMGWNEVRVIRPHPVLAGIRAGDECYFVHSYYAAPTHRRDALAVSDYGGEFVCAVGRGNYVATQFHTEKSGRVGLDLLARFLRWDGRDAE